MRGFLEVECGCGDMRELQLAGGALSLGAFVELVEELQFERQPGAQLLRRLGSLRGLLHADHARRRRYAWLRPLLRFANDNYQRLTQLLLIAHVGVLSLYGVATIKSVPLLDGFASAHLHESNRVAVWRVQPSNAFGQV